MTYLILCPELLDSAIGSLRKCVQITQQYPSTFGDLRAGDTSFSCTRLAYNDLLFPHTRQHFNLLLNPDWTWRGGLSRYLESLRQISASLRKLAPMLIPRLDGVVKDKDE